MSATKFPISPQARINDLTDALTSAIGTLADHEPDWQYYSRGEAKESKAGWDENMAYLRSVVHVTNFDAGLIEGERP